MAVLALVVSEPGCKNFLETSQGARGKHLRSERIGLQLLQVCLHRES